MHEVFDHERQAAVALKVPHDATAKSLFMFKKEFRALADVTHPNLVTLHELVSDGDQWFFTMELIRGPNLLHYLRRPQSVWTSPEREASSLHSPPLAEGLGSSGGSQPFPHGPYGAAEALDESNEEELPPVSAPRDFQLVSAAFKQLAQGLMAIHRAGMLHQDIKPSNVLVDQNGRVVLLDFGLSSEIEAVRETKEDPSDMTGTPAYMAPEQLLDHKCSEASDWYSVGVLLYHVLTGRLPFRGNGLRALINKVTQAPQPPSMLVSGIPAGLSQLCMQLLSPRPEDRPSGQEFLHGLELSESATTVERPAPARGGFVGRSQELTALLDAARQLFEKQPGWIHLHGGSGMGKTFLIRKFRKELQEKFPEILVLSGRCYEQEHVPYKALDGIIDALSQYLRQLPPAQVEEFLPSYAYALAQLFPVLQQVPKIAETRKRFAAIANPQELRHRAFGALRELLRRIGDQVPLVLIIDDLQWGDADSTVLLTDLLSPPDPPLLLLVACFRTEEQETSPTLVEFLALGRSAFGRCRELALAELSPDEALLLAENLLGSGTSVPEMATRRIALESGGNPFFIHELAQGWPARTLRPTRSTSLEAHVRARVAELTPEARRILQLAALAGYPLEWRILKDAAGIGAGGLESLDLLRRTHLIRTRVMDQRRMIEPYHDFIRKTVASALTLEQAREAHLQLAHAHERSPHLDVQALATHFKAAGETRKALEYLVSAGELAAESLAFSRAASLFRKALDLWPADDPASSRIWERLAESLANAGRGKEAAEAYLRAVPHALPREANRLQRAAAQEYLRGGHFQEGIAVLEGVLSAIGDHLATTRTQALASVIYHKIRIGLRGLRFRRVLPADIPQATLDRLDAYWVITMGLATGDLMRVADFQARQLLLSLQTGEPVRLIRALAYEAIFSSSRGNRAERNTKKFLDLALIHAERLGDPASMYQAVVASGIAHTAMGRWRKGAEILDGVEGQLRENTTGLTYELRNAQSYALINHYALGNLALLAKRLPALLREAEETGDLLFMANLKTGSAFMHHLARNEPEVARRDLQAIMGKLPEAGFFHQRFLELAAIGNIDLYCGNFRQGMEFLMPRWRVLQRSQMFAVQGAWVTCLELRARLTLALAAEAGEGKERQRFLKMARRDARAMAREHTDYGTALVLRLATTDACMQGRLEEAQGCAFMAENAFDACDMALHAATMKRFRGMIKGAAGAGLVHEADEWLGRQGVVDPERLTAMFLPGVKMG